MLLHTTQGDASADRFVKTDYGVYGDKGGRKTRLDFLCAEVGISSAASLAD